MKATLTRRWMILIALLIGSTFYFQGCGKSDSATGGAGSCTVADSGTGFTNCFDYTGSGYTSTTAQSSCASQTVGSTTGGTYSSSACTATGRVGSCLVFSGQPTAFYIRYFSSYVDGTAAAHCSALSGTYTSG